VSEVDNGAVVLRNAGEERFRGFELDSRIAPMPSRPLRLELGYAYHSPTFTHFSLLDDEGAEVVVDGNRLELAPKHVWNAGVSYLPASGPGMFAALHGAGSRPVNRRNSAFASPYNVVDIGASYAFGRHRVVGDLLNAGDSRHIIAESELADAQIYLNPPRRGTVELRVSF
jgi:outer membrane receptor protein involved in Fe transport